jgi:erythromycin esterase-like protein
MALQAISQAIRRHARELVGLSDVEYLLERIGDAQLVLMGEATHGTHEFYRMRIELTRRLIVDKGFDAVAVEADWPSALRASRFAQGDSTDATATAALADFERFPRWMWRNSEIVAWLNGLREHNRSMRTKEQRVGFFGLDLYSLRDSMDSVVRYLDQADPDAAQRARARYACFDDLANDPQAYGHAVTFGLRPDCERAVVQQLVDMCNTSLERLAGEGDGDELFYAQQNANVVRSAEAYYRSMFSGRVDSWNLRDTHMHDTLQALRRHLSERRGRPAKIAVWAHNSHLGDARATDSAARGQLNLGQLVRERQREPGESFLLGFTTHSGTVAAASDWDAAVEHKRVQPSRPDSIERLLHDSGKPRFVLSLRDAPAPLLQVLAVPRLQRAIGVIYRPETELWSHYFNAALSKQFDAVVHIDNTRAVHPLEAEHPWEIEPEPETYPTGI